MKEYVTVEGYAERVVWRLLAGGSFRELPRDSDGLFRSTIFPGLWLDPDALFADDGPRMAEVERLGLASAEHEAFVAQLSQHHK